MDTWDTWIFCVILFLLFCVNVNFYRIKGLQKRLDVIVAEQADAPDLGSGTQRECVGSSPVNGITKGGYVMKNVNRYENNEGKVILAYEGLSRPYHENEPFIEGFWILTDKYGSEQFIPKPEFIKIYREIKLPK